MKIWYGCSAALVFAFAVTFASAAPMTCNGDGLMKASAAVTAMPMGTPARTTGDKQIAAANTAMSKGDMRACNKALAGIKAGKK